jgi:hypothetical protein
MHIIPVAGRAFAEGAYTPVVSPETLSVHFAMPIKRTKQLKRVSKII